MPQSLRQAAGSLLVVGLSSPELTPLERSWLKLIRPAGIILFRRNIQSAAQTRALLAEATAFSPNAQLRCVDIEGGTVDRLRDAVTPMPSAQAVAQTGSPALMRLHGEFIAREALAFGFNTTLAPVLDLALPSSTKVMGTRSPSPTPAGVTQYTSAFLAGLARHGVIGCGKHFPGLGGGTLDSHLETPAIERPWHDLWQQDLAPYRDLAAELPMVMVTHAAYPKTSSKRSPATVSPFWVTTVLKKRLGYRGLIFSDDMEMGGILKFMSIEEAAIASLRAGIHLLEICHSPELIFRCYESLLSEAEKSIAFRKLILARAETAKRLRKTRFHRPTPRALSESQLANLKDKILRFHAKVESAAAKMMLIHKVPIHIQQIPTCIRPRRRSILNRRTNIHPWQTNSNANTAPEDKP